MKCRWAFGIIAGLLGVGIIAGCAGPEIICKAGFPAQSSSIEGGSITIAWDPNTEKNLTGYKIYYGSSPGKYKYCIDIGHPNESSPGVLRYTLAGLTKGERYYIALLAYDRNNKKSKFSNEVNAAAK